MAPFQRFLDCVHRDGRAAVRGLQRSPGFTAAIVLTLALGIGANAAMFGIVDRMMFRPYPYLRDPASVHRVYWRTFDRGIESIRWDGEYRRYLDFQESTTSFSEVAAFARRTVAVGTGDAARERPVAMVSASFFGFFDARPELGRFFSAADDVAPEGANVVVLGHAFWQSGLGGRDVIGERLLIDQIPAVIVGIAPAGFTGAFDGEPPAAYIPITTYAGLRGPSYLSTYSWRWIEMMVRRKPGVSIEEASADATRAAVQTWTSRRVLEPDLPSPAAARPSAILASLRLGAGPDPSLEARTALWVAGVAAIVLLIACANVSNLFLARGLRRQSEHAVRLALGGTRGRLLAESLTESLVLASLGSMAGLVVAQWGGATVRGLYTNDPMPMQVFSDVRTLAATAAITLVVGLIIGLVPALLAGHSDVASALRSGGRHGTYRGSRARSALLIVQAALSVVLLVGAGLFVRSLDRVTSMHMGYDGESVLLATANLRGVQLDDSARIRLGSALLRAAQTLPNVEHASSVMTVPLLETGATYLGVAGIDDVDQLGMFSYQSTTPDYFRVMRTRILRGRGITDEDRAESPRVTVVSESMARVLWPGQDPIGQRMRVFSDTTPWATVVGVAEDIVQSGVSEPQRYHYYLSSSQFWPQWSSSRLLVRARGDVAAAAERLRVALQAEMPGASYMAVRPFRELVDAERRSWRLGAMLFAGFGLLALIVAAVGLYAVIGYEVAQRRREVGIRVALGARSRDVVRLVLWQGARFALVGTALGCGLAVVGGRWIQPLLFQVSAADPAVYGAVVGVMLLVALGASALPAGRAVRSDPNVALRSE